MGKTTQNSTGTDFKIKLEIISYEYRFLANTIRNHKKTLFMLNINEIMKKELITDMEKIQSLLAKSETGTVPVT